MFEQLFQAYEQKLPRKALREFRRKQWVNPAKYPYDCPGERLLEVEYKTTPSPAYSLRWIQEWAPVYGFLAFSFLFLGVSLGIGIFRRAPAPAATCTPVLHDPGALIVVRLPVVLALAPASARVPAALDSDTTAAFCCRVCRCPRMLQAVLH